MEHKVNRLYYNASTYMSILDSSVFRQETDETEGRWNS